MKKWKIGIYRRRSFDERNEEESNSVANQKRLIDDYLLDKNDIIVYKDYVDDGYTGTDFNRPGYKRMLNDIKNRKINGVVVKDLSRLGRNYIEVGNFIDEIVPQYSLRFISVNDNVDSIKNPNIMQSLEIPFKNPNIMQSLEIPFKNLLNESYSKDSSKKMRTALKASKKSGNFIGKIAPYGYLKDPDDSHKLIIDKDAANVVKRIFDLALKGRSKQEIVEELTNNNILTPSVYLKEKYNIKVSRISRRWNTKMLDTILQNKTYIGSLVQCKRTRISHKTHNMVRVAEDEWVVSKKRHNAIIKEEIFNQVQDILYNRNVRVNKEGKFYKYTGFLKCSECGANLYRKTKIKNNKEKVYYYCSTYYNTRQCNKHYIQEKELDEVVLEILNQHIELVCDISNKIEDVISVSRVEYNAKLKEIRISEIEKELEKYQVLLNELVKDYRCDFISQEDYDDFKQKYLYEINKLNMEKENLEISKINSYNLDWINNFKKTGKIKTIDRNIVDSFIKDIFVNNEKGVDIIFRYKDEYENAERYLKSKNNVV